MEELNPKKVAVIGLGPAGVSCAIYLKRYGMEPVCFEKELVGGKVNKTETIENYAGLSKVKGPVLGAHLEDQLTSFSIKPIYRNVTSLTKNEDGSFHLVYGKEEQDFSYVVLANGLKERPYHMDGEETFLRRGISSCAICDGPLYKGKNVAVVGAGNAAFEEASYLATICNSVTLIARRKEYRADMASVERFLSYPNAKVLSPYEIISAKGTSHIEEITVRNKETMEESSLSIDGLFLYVGEIPQNDFIHIDGLQAENGFIRTDDGFMTSVKDLYAIGDCVDKKLRQVATAVSDGAIAATSIHDDYMKR